jgi:hypothetical protein
VFQRDGWKYLAAVVALIGCGDDGGPEGGPLTSGSKNVSALCGEICVGMRRAACPGIDLNRCETLCGQEYAATPALCRATADQLLDCASKATFSCGVDGPEATFCAGLEARLEMCSATGQPPVQGEDDGGVPTLPSSDGGGTTLPGDGATSQPREDAGTPGQTDAATSDAAVPAQDGGSSVVSCQPAADDEACDTCLKGRCCAETQACGPACQALGACIGECLTEACVDGCLAANPSGATQFEAVLDCAESRCEAECGDESGSDGGMTPNVRPPPANICLPTYAPEGTCTNPALPIGYDCSSQPFSDCVAVPNIFNVYCCGAG